MSNALTGKITSILAASYADLEIRDALETLDSRGVRNTQETRRDLRLDVQKDVIQSNGEIVQDFGQVAMQLQNVGVALANLQKTCAEMRAHIKTAQSETAPIIDEANTLMKQKEQVETKQQILDAFTAHFQLTDDELNALTSTVEPVNSAFFAALVKAKKIHKDSQVLLGSESQRLGLEILEQSSKHLNAGFTRLHRWLHREFKTLSVDLDNPNIMNAQVRRALRVLAERPSLFQTCLDAFAEARERGLSDAFYAALTGEPLSGDAAPATRQKPIEFSAHEPLRYVGDMLAWAHSATVSEREALEGLFLADGEEIARGIQEGLESDPWSRSATSSSEAFDGRTALAQLVNRSLAGVAQLLRQRVEQVVHNHDEPVLAYRVANLVRFYRHVFAKLVDPAAGFMQTLTAAEDSALDRFRTTMRWQVASLKADEAPTPPAALSPPEFLHEALEELAQLLRAYDTTTAAAPASTAAENERSLDLVLAEALDPILDHCDATLARAVPSPQSTVFSVNCLLAARAALAAFPFAADKAADLADATDELAEALAHAQHTFLHDASGLAPLLAALDEASAAEGEDADAEGEAAFLASIAAHPAFAPAALSAASARLDAFLPSAAMDAAARVQRLGDAGMAEEATREGAERFAVGFERVEEAVVRVDEARMVRAAREMEAEEGEESGERVWLRDYFPRTGEEIRILLS